MLQSKTQKEKEERKSEEKEGRKGEGKEGRKEQRKRKGAFMTHFHTLCSTVLVQDIGLENI